MDMSLLITLSDVSADKWKVEMSMFCCCSELCLALYCSRSLDSTRIFLSFKDLADIFSGLIFCNLNILRAAECHLVEEIRMGGGRIVYGVLAEFDDS